jgi:hypothetical protein
MRGMNIKPIETHYKGYRFRSRLEARWAVFFDAMGLEWEYEKEGFDLGDGRYYLPDFWLPQVQMWAEVKGEEFTEGQKSLCEALAMQSKNDVLLLAGMPDYKAYPLIFRYDFAEEDEGYPAAQPAETDCYLTTDYLDENRFYQSVGEDEAGQRACLEDDYFYVQAVNAARSARFERGETPNSNTRTRHYGEGRAFSSYRFDESRLIWVCSSCKRETRTLDPFCKFC